MQFTVEKVNNDFHLRPFIIQKYHMAYAQALFDL